MTELSSTPHDCWNRIGVSGDGSCPELKKYIHCRNCPVYASAARSVFDREAPPGYLTEWSRTLANPEQALERDRASIAIFRLNTEWLGLHISSLLEVTTPTPVHRIPHRGNNVLHGLANVRGQLRLFVSLHGLLGIDHESTWWRNTTDGSNAVLKGRYVVYQVGSEAWVFPTEEVVGVYRIARSQLRGVISGRTAAAHSFAQAVFTWRDHHVAYLDEHRIAIALRELGT